MSEKIYVPFSELRVSDTWDELCDEEAYEVLKKELKKRGLSLEDVNPVWEFPDESGWISLSAEIGDNTTIRVLVFYVTRCDEGWCVVVDEDHHGVDGGEVFVEPELEVVEE